MTPGMYATLALSALGLLYLFVTRKMHRAAIEKLIRIELIYYFNGKELSRQTISGAEAKKWSTTQLGIARDLAVLKQHEVYLEGEPKKEQLPNGGYKWTAPARQRDQHGTYVYVMQVKTDS